MRRSHRAKAAGPGRRQAPNASELVAPLEGSLGLLTLFVGLMLCGFNLEDPLVDVVMMEKEEAERVAKPLANILVQQKWFAEYGRHLVNSDDAIALTYAMILYTGRVYPAIRGRMGERPRRDRAQQTARVPMGTATPTDPGLNGYAAAGRAGLSGAYAAD